MAKVLKNDCVHKIFETCALSEAAQACDSKIPSWGHTFGNEDHLLNNFTISCNFDWGIVMVLCIVSICIPRAVTEVLEGTNFLRYISKPRSARS